MVMWLYLWSPRGVVANVLDGNFVVSEFELQSHYYIHFRTNSLGERYEPPYTTSNGLYSTTTVLLQGWLRHKIAHEDWYAIKQRKLIL